MKKPAPLAPGPRPVVGFGMRSDDAIEVLRPSLPRGRFRSVLFDFDGTLSLLREGWPQVMIPMMVAELRRTGTAESDAMNDLGKPDAGQPQVRFDEEALETGGPPWRDG